MTIATASTTRDCAAAFSDALLRAAGGDQRICIVINDSAETHKALGFQEQYPDRMIDVGIAEQNMVGVAAGLANAGRVPFVYSAGCFLTARALEQIKVDVAYAGAKVVLCGFVSGLAYGALGGSHHAIEDLAWMRAIPNLVVLAPATPIESSAAVEAALAHDGPVYVRIISKEAVPEMFAQDHRCVVGGSDLLRTGRDVTLISTGFMSGRSLAAASRLADAGIEASVLHLGSVKPLDVAAIVAATTTGPLVVVEDHTVNGGLAGAVAEVVVASRPVPVLSIGIPDVFAPIGPSSFLYEHFDLTAEGIARRVLEWVPVTEVRGA